MKYDKYFKKTNDLRMSKNISSNFHRFLLILLLFWLTVSAFYYVQDLFNPSFSIGYDEGTLHKTVKYIVCLLLSICLCFAARAWSLLLFCGVMLLIAMYYFIDGGKVETTILHILVFGTMAPFILIPKLFENRLLLIGRTVVICAAIVGIFSIIEVTLLSSLYQSAYAYRGSLRSVSTLYNPNNLGLYAGSALLLLPYMKMKNIWFFISASLIITSLVLSDSRSAIASLVLVLIYALIANPNIRKIFITLVLRHLNKIVLIGSIIFTSYAVRLIYSDSIDLEIMYRGLDFHTLILRWDSLIMFFDLVDIGIFFPDIEGVRTEYIQDSSYLAMLNAFGIIGILCILIFFKIFFSSWRNKDPALFPWKLVFIFYIISSVSVSPIISFPNNQLFFLSMGSVLIYRFNSFRRIPA